MFVKKSSRNKARGIGLLELMLSLAIIAILLVMAVRYFVATNESQKINNAISMIHGLAGGAANYAIAHPAYSGIGIDTLLAGNYVPKAFGGSDGKGAGANPWNGNIAVAAATVGGAAGFTVTMSSVPTSGTVSVCTKIENMLKNSGEGTAACDKGTLTVNFH